MTTATTEGCRTPPKTSSAPTRGGGIFTTCATACGATNKAAAEGSESVVGNRLVPEQDIDYVALTHTFASCLY